LWDGQYGYLSLIAEILDKLFINQFYCTVWLYGHFTFVHKTEFFAKTFENQKNIGYLHPKIKFLTTIKSILWQQE
jgi:hypothetical protein